MKNQIIHFITFIAASYLLIACNTKEAKQENEPLNPPAANVVPKADIVVFTSDQSSFKPIVPKLANKDIATYLEDESLSSTALLYYLGKKDASPDTAFLSIFDSLSVSATLNPLRWHLLNKVVLNADGVLAESLSDIAAKKIVDNPDEFTTMLLDTAYSGRMEVAKNYAFLLAHNIQQDEKGAQTEDKMVIRAMLACATCSDKQKAVLGHFFEMVDGLKDY